MALINKLENIGAAIRAKTGKEDLLTLDQMVEEIAAIETGGGDIEVEPIVLTGEQQYGCAGAMSSKFIELFGDKVSTSEITSCTNMFLNYTNDTIPFEINCNKNSTGFIKYTPLQSMFSNSKIKVAPKVLDANPYSMKEMFVDCKYLREIPQDFTDTWVDNYLKAQTGAYSGDCGSRLKNCYSLRSYPNSLLRFYNPKGSANYLYYSTFTGCCSLDEIKDLPVYEDIHTSNMFSMTFNNCYRLKTLTFELDNGQPKVAEWKAQVIDLTSYLGYTTTSNCNIIYEYNSGITADKLVNNDATYQALKNDKDWFAGALEYSRYNHDSAVETINSLPDTSAYLATAGGTNTIKFKGTAGSKTDGGAINTLTEAEIAVAAAKGWTVSIA